jgi:CheY-like chemotaxis protein/anti-sigma regulatory factor (Ser/Thr protein kinase)
MATVLVVDDSAVDRHLAGALVQKQPGWQAVYAADGQEALGVLEREKADVVLTDLHMPNLNGLELVEAIKLRYPAVPVILMTARGSEDVAVAALQEGAASYVPKRDLAQQLHVTLANVLDLVQARRDHDRVMACLERATFSFRLGNDLTLIPHVVGHLGDSLAGMKRFGDNNALRLGVALREALINAVYHGNLEMAGPAPGGLGAEEAEEAVARRAQEPPYRDRFVYLTATESPDALLYVVRDEGPGFDTSRLPDPRDPAAFQKYGDRGLMLIRTFMDEVRFNAAGNEIIMLKRCRASSSQ